MTSRLPLLASIVVTTVAALQNGGMQQTPPAYGSRVTIYDLAGASSTVVYEADTVWEAPNWSRDGTFLLSNSGGKLYRIPVDGSSPPSALAVDPSLRCNNDHDLSPDGTRIAISASSPSSRQSQIYVADADGSDSSTRRLSGAELFPRLVAGRQVSVVRGQPRRQAVRPLSRARRRRT